MLWPSVILNVSFYTCQLTFYPLEFGVLRATKYYNTLEPHQLLLWRRHQPEQSHQSPYSGHFVAVIRNKILHCNCSIDSQKSKGDLFKIKNHSNRIEAWSVHVSFGTPSMLFKFKIQNRDMFTYIWQLSTTGVMRVFMGHKTVEKMHYHKQCDNNCTSK